MSVRLYEPKFLSESASQIGGRDRRMSEKVNEGDGKFIPRDLNSSFPLMRPYLIESGQLNGPRGNTLRVVPLRGAGGLGVRWASTTL